LTPPSSSPSPRPQSEAASTDGEIARIRIGGHVFLDQKEFRTKLSKLFQPTTK